MSIGERIANRALGSFMVGGSEHAALVITTTGSMARIRRINSTRHEFTIARTGESQSMPGRSNSPSVLRSLARAGLQSFTDLCNSKRRWHIASRADLQNGVVSGL